MKKQKNQRYSITLETLRNTADFLLVFNSQLVASIRKKELHAHAENNCRLSGFLCLYGICRLHYDFSLHIRQVKLFIFIMEFILLSCGFKIVGIILHVMVYVVIRPFIQAAGSYVAGKQMTWKDAIKTSRKGALDGAFLNGIGHSIAGVRRILSNNKAGIKNFYFNETGSIKIDGLSGSKSGTSLKQKTYQTYTKKNPLTGEVYSGRTSGTGNPFDNVARRDVNHHMNEKGFLPAQLDQTSTNYNAIRGREQMLIEANGGAKSVGGTSGNAINGIGPNNKKKDIYINAAKELLGEIK